MTLRICQESDNCPDDITGNFSSEADDTLDFISNRFVPAPPKIGNLWTQIECGVTFVSRISQADADQQAAAAAGLCANNNCQGAACNTNPTFCNVAQTACFACPDGTPSCFTVPAGTFCGYANQASADSAAKLAAQNLARSNPVCPGPLTKCTCVGSGYMSQIVANIPVSWTLVGGSIPPGLAFAGGTGVATSIFGIPTLAGTYNFQLSAVDPVSGAFAIKTYSIVVLQITTTTLPPFTLGVPYSFQLQAIGGSGNYNWKITSGTLPNGLIMSLTGLISGTPM